MPTIFANLKFLIVGLFGVGFLLASLGLLIYALYTGRNMLVTVLSILGVIIGALISIGAYLVFTGEVNNDANFLYNLFIGLLKEPIEQNVVFGIWMLRWLNKRRNLLTLKS